MQPLAVSYVLAAEQFDCQASASGGWACAPKSTAAKLPPRPAHRASAVSAPTAVAADSTSNARESSTTQAALVTDSQGKGRYELMTALIERAERWMQMTRLELEVYVDNAAAIALYRKHGFVEEGRMRAYAFRDGQYVDALGMARVKQ